MAGQDVRCIYLLCIYFSLGFSSLGVCGVMFVCGCDFGGATKVVSLSQLSGMMLLLQQ